MSIERRILITGAASGIGAALCRRMAGPGTHFVVHTRRNAQGAETTAADIRAVGGTADIVLTDLAEAGAGRRLVASAVERLGGLDVLIANAGYALRKSPIEATEAIPHLCTSTAGRIIAVSAFGPHVWRTQVPAFAVTSAAKASMEAMAKALALDLAPEGVTVNVVSPGFIEKDLGAHFAVPPETATVINQQIPMGRKGSQDEVAAVIEFVASEAASYVTGQVIHVNGGLV
jgi:3-oxoacyl-[acyl-carrier protein] reductase